MDARMAAVQAGLKLDPEQQRLWGPVEQALRAQAATRLDRVEERRRSAENRQERRSDLMERLDRRAERAKERADRLQTFATAMRPFWASLSEDQKRLLPVLLRQASGSRHGYGHHGHRGHHHRG